MKEEETCEQVIQGIVELLKSNPFSVEFKVKKKPAGIKVIYEVTREEMDELMKQQYGQAATT